MPSATWQESAAIERPEPFEDPELAGEPSERMLGYLPPTAPSRSAKERPAARP